MLSLLQSKIAGIPVKHFLQSPFLKKSANAHFNTSHGQINDQSRTSLRIQASSSDGGNEDKGPETAVLRPKVPGIGYTFVLAGFLKIITITAVANSAPVDLARTALGKMSPYLLIPVGLLLCWIAKSIVDNNLHENNRFMTFVYAILIILYFGLSKVLYRYQPRRDSEIVLVDDKPAAAVMRQQKKEEEVFDPTNAREYERMRLGYNRLRQAPNRPHAVELERRLSSQVAQAGLEGQGKEA